MRRAVTPRALHRVGVRTNFQPVTADESGDSGAQTAPAVADPIAPVRYLTLELTTEGIAEWDDHRHAVFVPRDAIVGIELRRGPGGERPIVQIVVGLVLLALGVTLLGALAAAGGSPRTAGRVSVAGAPLTIVGVYLLWSAVRPALYLYVRLKGDARKLLIRGKADLPSLAEALREASVRFGYEVTWQIPRPEQPGRPYRTPPPG